jgi:hypothetical protein
MRPHPPLGTPAWLVAALLAGATATAHADINVAITPAMQTVAPGASFAVQVSVTQPGSPFNGFDLTVAYDAAALTFLPTVPTSLQEGVYMTSVCGATFHQFRALADSFNITDVLLCADSSRTGPGQIYTLHFRAGTTPQYAHIGFRSAQFYDAGLFTGPTVTTDGYVQIGTPPAGVGRPGAPGTTRVTASPNPFRAGTALAIEAARDGRQSLEILDLQGRIVRHLADGEFVAGPRTVAWDGRDDDGRALPAGVYRALLRAGESRGSTLVALVR